MIFHIFTSLSRTSTNNKCTRITWVCVYVCATFASPKIRRRRQNRFYTHRKETEPSSKNHFLFPEHVKGIFVIIPYFLSLFHSQFFLSLFFLKLDVIFLHPTPPPHWIQGELLAYNQKNICCSLTSILELLFCSDEASSTCANV